MHGKFLKCDKRLYSMFLYYSFLPYNILETCGTSPKYMDHWKFGRFEILLVRMSLAID